MIYVISVLLSFILTMGAYRIFLPSFKKLNMNQIVSEYALQDYKDKPITPTMGGLVFVGITVILSILLNKVIITAPSFWLAIFALIFFGFVGFIDDLKIILEGKNNGLSERFKLCLQLFFAFVIAVIYQFYFPTTILIPVVNISLNLGYFYIIFVLLMMSGSSNAVNLTDGVDGLSSMTFIISTITLIILSIVFKETQLAVLLCVLLGSLFGYFLNNKKPAKIYMGDTGSLALGGLLAVVGMVLKIEIAIIFIGLIFVLETLSVVIQITSVKLRKKRVFPYTPIHYTFILKGWNENKVVFWFSAVQVLGCLMGALLAWR